ncbi:hypothetical protein ALP45_04078 [Pseudomonas coronafaciens pv. atropurpurea]|uniref:hypothetical protein n=1 Tax=Pseudomonas coronafaciens TaxID=53409 RepID=UPI0006D5DF3E|nr:hypothetical protein [Pseudomonas coronafaciens]KPW36450.1 Uncharacterized protein ALO66_01975 [Pseudomonas coronafaciens pv. atropurpurea]RMT56444.1 hypothetical protein ALP45_04078 [Pseudomonas coronafaciens pv. atropurpurea]
MNTENKRSPVPLILISLGIWLPIIYAALTLYVSQGASDQTGAAFGGMTVILAQVEIFAVIFLLVYAFAIKPWRLSKKVRTAFFINVLGAAFAAITIIITLARMH